jgi:hypothetical protein
LAGDEEHRKRRGQLLGIGYVSVVVGFLSAGYSGLVWDKASAVLRVALVAIVSLSVMAVLIVMARLHRLRRD